MILLNSPLHYPMYNGKKERSMRDIKSYVRALHLNKVSSSLDTKLKLAVHDLNEECPRPVLGGMTAKDVFFNQRQKLPSRERFQIRVKTAQLKWKEKSTDRKQMDSARRKAIEEALLHYDLLKLKGNASTDLNRKTVTH